MSASNLKKLACHLAVLVLAFNCASAAPLRADQSHPRPQRTCLVLLPVVAQTQWELRTPKELDDWWNGLSPLARAGIGTIALVVAVLNIIYAPEFLVVAVIYFIGTVVATIRTGNFFWVFTGSIFLVSAIVALGFHKHLRDKSKRKPQNPDTFRDSVECTDRPER